MFNRTAVSDYAEFVRQTRDKGPGGVFFTANTFSKIRLFRERFSTRFLQFSLVVFGPDTTVHDVFPSGRCRTTTS